MLNIDFIEKNFPKGNLSLIGGRPAMGKTVMAISLALSLALRGKRIIFFSLEMAKDSLVRRMKQQIGEVQYQQIEWLITIDDTPGAELCEMEEQLESCSYDYMFVDYLHLIHCHEQESRETEFVYLINAFRRMAERHNLGIVVNSQLSRACPKGSFRPTLSSFGTISTDTLENVRTGLIHRPDYYVNYGHRSTEDENNMEFITYYKGTCNTFLLHFNKKTTEISHSTSNQ